MWFFYLSVFSTHICGSLSSFRELCKSLISGSIHQTCMCVCFFLLSCLQIYLDRPYRRLWQPQQLPRQPQRHRCHQRPSPIHFEKAKVCFLSQKKTFSNFNYAWICLINSHANSIIIINLAALVYRTEILLATEQNVCIFLFNEMQPEHISLVIELVEHVRRWINRTPFNEPCVAFWWIRLSKISNRSDHSKSVASGGFLYHVQKSISCLLPTLNHFSSKRTIHLPRVNYD